MVRFQISRILDFGPIRLGLRAVLNDPKFSEKFKILKTFQIVKRRFSKLLKKPRKLLRALGFGAVIFKVF